jgi:UDP-N-acetylmuramoylalanine--D-glutamate ligase
VSESTNPVLILGLGASGLAMARWCAGRGARVRVWDSRTDPPQAAALAAEVPGAALFSGELEAAALDGVSRVYKSPGLSPADARLAPLLEAARAAEVPVRGELDLFVEALERLQAERGYAPQVLAITGTNGKTTTTSLTGLIVERAGRRVAVAGNIGPTMLDTLAAALAEQDAADAAAAVQAAEGAGAAEPAVAADTPADRDATAGVDADEDEDAAPEDDAEPAAVAPDDDAPVVALIPPPPPAPVFSHLPQVWVLELSSFQLDGVRRFAPSASAVLNVTQDHLDWHGTAAAYARAKAQVYGLEPDARTVLVVNRDDPAVEAMVPEPVVVKPAARGQRSRTTGRRVVRFGLGAPRAPGDFGLVEENGMAWLVRAIERDETIKRKPGEVDEIVLNRLMPADALRIRGRHNAANALAALALATAIGLPLAPMLHGLREYRGEPHRVEPVGQAGAVEFFDDSKGTNVGATVAALAGLGLDRAPAKLVVILGGDGKGQDFAPLAEPLRRHARAAATLGKDAGALEAVLQSAGVPFERHATLPDATRWALAQARPGDAVLLSPACASLDMFRDYKHRADVFVQTLRELAGDEGALV